MLVPFLKMHGCGNDFVVFDERDEPCDLAPALVTALADRRTGIGFDQLIAIGRPPRKSGATAFMRIWNPDGSEAGACGNATRCVGGLIARESHRRKLVIATVSGNLPVSIGRDDEAEVDMGPPGLDWTDVPLAEERATLHLDLGSLPQGLQRPAALSMGNPHATFFVPDISAVAVEEVGPALEHHPLFPDRANIGFAHVLAPDRIRLRVWERGAGLTRACGSGACAAVVNAHRRGLAGRHAHVELDGGTLEIAWRAKDGHVLMTGPSTTTFTGVIDLSIFPHD